VFGNFSCTLICKTMSVRRAFFSARRASSVVGKSNLVAVPCCYSKKEFQHASRHDTGDKYVRGLSLPTGVIPMLIPCLEDVYSKHNKNWALDLVSRVDGVMLTGSPSNIHPSRYNTEPTEFHKGFDEDRDAIVFELIDAAFKLKKPLLGICRGHQELNVYMGGTICPNINDQPNMDGVYHGFPTDKREEVDDNTMSYQDIKYGHAHKIKLQEGGLLKNILKRDEILVNSCHYQALDKIGSGLHRDALAPDGLVEALSVEDPDHWALSVQWHPEYKSLEDSNKHLIFKAFNEALSDAGKKRKYA